MDLRQIYLARAEALFRKAETLIDRGETALALAAMEGPRNIRPAAKRHVGLQLIARATGGPRVGRLQVVYRNPNAPQRREFSALTRPLLTLV